MTQDYKENDKYLQLGWDWAIDEVEMCLDYYFTERHSHRKTYQRDELVRMYRTLIKAMRNN